MGRSGHRVGFRVVLGVVQAAASAALVSACGGEEPATESAQVLTGDAWVPNVPGAGATNHDANVTVAKSTLASTTGPLTGLGQGWSGREISVTIDMTSDLGSYGSLTLLAQTTGFPSALSGGAYPILTYLSDGTHELVNLSRAGGGNCLDSGAYTCVSGDCSTNASCAINWPSAYFDRSHWLQHQINTSFKSYISVNTFPSCNWSGTTTPASGSPYNDPTCAFNSTFFVGGKLRSGVSYTAKYVLMTDSYSSLSGYTAGLQVSVIKKSKSSAANPGALDLNLIFVGYDVSQDSRNSQGKINLDTLLSAVHDYLGTSSVNVKLGEITAYEWTAGEQYADLKTTDFGAMAAAASAMVSASSEGKAINVFFVNSVTNSSSLLGQSGGIGGPMLNGLRNSGVVVSTFGMLDRYNAGCASAPCGADEIDYDFATLEQTVAHEIGHYLGLNHPSESSGTLHDLVNDTPLCTATDPGATVNGSPVITINSCLNLDSNVFPSTSKTCIQQCSGYNSGADSYCPTAVECSFNYMMYWSSKYFSEGVGTGDGNLFSNGQGTIINYCPLIQ